MCVKLTIVRFNRCMFCLYMHIHMAHAYSCGSCIFMWFVHKLIIIHIASLVHCMSMEIKYLVRCLLLTLWNYLNPFNSMGKKSIVIINVEKVMFNSGTVNLLPLM